ncbi:MAG: hypothetical protein WBW48_12175 [Anaerolineae bacterium]
MNVLDENISRIQRQLLRDWHISVQHIGYEIGRKGMKDDEIIPFLLTLHRPTFFTLDWDYFKHSLCHARYCLVFLDVKQDESAVFIRRFLRHQEFDTQAKRMGTVIRASYAGLFVWRLHAQQETYYAWE